MGKYVVKRLLVGLLAVVVSLCFNFFLIRIAPGDPVTIMAGHDNPNQEMIDNLTQKYGLDQPIHIQFVRYLGNLVRGDMGYSFRSGKPVTELIGERILPTMMISLTGAVLAFLIGTAIGLLAARNIDSKLDKAVSGLSYIFDAMPSFWLALMLILLFASTLGWFPTAGMVNLRAGYTGFRYVLDVLHHMVLPVTTLVLITTPMYFRICRSSVLQVMSEDYITLFRATGMDRRTIFRQYVLKNAILPVLTVFGMSIAYIFMGSSFIEIVFAWPGMGRLLLDSIFKRDYMVLSGIYLIFSVMVAVMMVLMDVVQAMLDPRVRLR